MWYILRLLFQSVLIYRLLKVLAKLWNPLYSFWICPKLGWTVKLAEYQDYWSVITGCTDGIGKAYTEELAKRGLKKFVLISRNKAKLQGFSKYLTAKYKADVRIIVYDFSSVDYSTLEEGLKEFQGNIGILVNNVGTGPVLPEKFCDLPNGSGEEMFKVNALSMIKMCQMILPTMVARDKGIIVNVASIQGWRPMPWLSAYSASKACVSFLSECLSTEHNSMGVRIQCLFPVIVATKMTHYDKADGWKVADVETYAKQAVDIIGIGSATTGCILHEIQVAILAFIPFWILRPLLGPIFTFERKRISAIIDKEKRKE